LHADFWKRPTDRQAALVGDTEMPFLKIAIPIMLVIVLAVLITGVVAMARGGEFNQKYGNRLMQLRVATQFIAVILIALFFYVSRS
jgi:hypothetical protein